MVEAREGSDGSYQVEVEMISAACKIESNCGMQYTQVGGIVPWKSEYQNSYRGKLGGQLGVICKIQIMKSILDSTRLVVNSCDNINALIQALIHPEAVKS